MPKRIMIAGHGKHGKDTLAEMLWDLFKVPHQSSSFAAKDLVFANSKELQLKYQDAQAAWEDRRTEHNRILWHEAICEINLHDKTTLARKIYETSDVYIGMRCPDEHFACKESGVIDLSVWVQNDREPAENVKSNKLTADMCDCTIHNNGSLDQLREKARTVLGPHLEDSYRGVPLLYVGGPYSAKTHEGRVQNVHQAMIHWLTLRSKGVTPVIPHLCHYIDCKSPHGYEFWMSYCFDLLSKCQAMYRIPGMSRGTDRETEFCRERGIPVFYDHGEAVDYIKSRMV